LYALDGSVRTILKSTLQAVLYLWYDMRMMQKTLTYSDLLTKGSVSNAVVDRVSDSDLSIESIPLYAGDKLTRAEFERRYEAHPEIKKAELIEGIVYMASPVKYKRHGSPHLFLNTWIGTYLAFTPGLDGGDNATIRMDDENEPQPDVLMRFEQAVGGNSRIAADDYLEGAPELIIEVAASSASYDMHAKKPVYARNGVQEYLLVLTYERRAYWYTLTASNYEEINPDPDGILRSKVFPGLWLQPKALWQRNPAALLAVLNEGLASSEHAAFVEQLSRSIE